MKSMKKLASILFAIVLSASMAVAPAASAFADESSNASAAADAISQTPSVATESLSGSAAAESEASAQPSASITANDNVRQQIENGQYVISEDSLLSSSDIERLSALAKPIIDTYQVSPYYITVDSLQGFSGAASFAEAYAEAYGLNTRSAKGCVLFVVCVNESKFGLSSIGDASDTFTDSTLDYLGTDLDPYLGRKDWSGAGETFFGDVQQTLGGGKANASSDVPYNGTYVTDNYGLFTDEQRSALEATATELAQKYNMGVYLLVVDKMNGLDNPTSAQRTNFATSFYRANDLGLGSGKDGIMLVLAVKSRDYVTIAYGQGSYSFSDEGIEAMEEAVKDELRSDDWVDGAKAYYSRIGEQLEYYSATGKTWTEPDPISFVLKILAILGIPAGVAFSSVRSQENAMKTAREKSEASDYLVPGSFNLTESSDNFSHTTHVVTPLPKHDDDSGGGGGFGGGGWGGGGGGGFSSSGGGKF